jgi:hypothetical protein
VPVQLRPKEVLAREEALEWLRAVAQAEELPGLSLMAHRAVLALAGADQAIPPGPEWASLQRTSNRAAAALLLPGLRTPLVKPLLERAERADLDLLLRCLAPHPEHLADFIEGLTPKRLLAALPLFQRTARRTQEHVLVKVGAAGSRDRASLASDARALDASTFETWSALCADASASSADPHAFREVVVELLSVARALAGP